MLIVSCPLELIEMNVNLNITCICNDGIRMKNFISVAQTEGRQSFLLTWGLPVWYTYIYFLTFTGRWLRPRLDRNQTTDVFKSIIVR